MKSTEFLDKMETAFAWQLQKARLAIKKTPELYEVAHTWLQQFAVGVGLDIATGNFPTMTADDENVSIAIDSSLVIGPMINGFNFDATKLTGIDSNSMDYVLSNYLEGIEATLNALHEWSRVLKPGGTLALVVVNAESKEHQKPRGPLGNRRKVTCFTQLTLQRYLERAGFVNIKFDNQEPSIRVSAKKP